MNPLAAYRQMRPIGIDLAADIHPERWRAAGIDEPGQANLAACPRARATLSGCLDWLFGPEASADGNFSDWIGALAEKPGEWALRPGAELWRAGRCLGAGRLRHEIARLVRRGDVADFKSAVGEDAYLFALRQAPMIWRGAPAPGPETEMDSPLADRALSAAGWGLGCWLASLPPGLSRRARAKLPISRDPEFMEAASWPGPRQDAWRAELGKVFQWIHN